MYNSQEIAAKIKKLLAEKKISARKMLLDCNLSINTLFTMQKTGYFPRVDTLTKIADYLGCSVDHLLGREYAENKSAEILSEKEKKLISAYRNQPDIQPAVDRLLMIDGPLRMIPTEPAHGQAKVAAFGGGQETVTPSRSYDEQKIADLVSQIDDEQDKE